MENTETKVTPALYCGTYAKYNNGSIAGEWLKLDDYADADEFLKACRELHKDESDPELMFQDYEGFPKGFYSESMGTKELERLYGWIDLDADDQELVEEYTDATGYDVSDIESMEIEDIRDKQFCQVENLWNKEKEIGEYVVENGGLGIEVPEQLQNYIDYEAIGRDSLMDMSVSSNGFVFTD